jgi:hypothetical protein
LFLPKYTAYCWVRMENNPNFILSKTAEWMFVR